MDKKKSLRVEDRKTGIEEVLADLEREKTPTEQTCAWWLDISKKKLEFFFSANFLLDKRIFNLWNIWVVAGQAGD